MVADPCSKAIFEKYKYQAIKHNTDDTTEVFQIFTDEDCKTVSGTHESEIMKLGEDEAHKLFMNCKKNTHHEQFFPVEPFSLNDLPVGCREYHWLRLIKALAALTVRVDVTTISVARPEFIPGTHHPYPYCNIRGSKTLRTGSGYLTEITPIKRTSEIFCTCKKNKKFNKCKKKFWVLKVKTSKQVVFDEIEAKNTSILFSFDPPVCGNSTVRLDTCTEIYEDTLSFVSCADICKQLAKLFADYVAVNCAHFDHSTSKFDINDCPVFIVSHPHGGSKKITIGERHSVVKVDKGYHKLLYTTSTCPGSSGAPVYDMADHDIKTHGGSMENGLSYSENYY